VQVITTLKLSGFHFKHLLLLITAAQLGSSVEQDLSQLILIGPRLARIYSQLTADNEFTEG
jgi:hypothetical protein